jgi:hypothetical protein
MIFHTRLVGSARRWYVLFVCLWIWRLWMGWSLVFVLWRDHIIPFLYNFQVLVIRLERFMTCFRLCWFLTNQFNPYSNQLCYIISLLLLIVTVFVCYRQCFTRKRIFLSIGRLWVPCDRMNRWPRPNWFRYLPRSIHQVLHRCSGRGGGTGCSCSVNVLGSLLRCISRVRARYGLLIGRRSNSDLGREGSGCIGISSDWGAVIVSRTKILYIKLANV